MSVFKASHKIDKAIVKAVQKQLRKFDKERNRKYTGLISLMTYMSI